MNQGLRQLQGHELLAALEDLLFPRMVEQLVAREPGHCMRIGDLDIELMARLCRRLRAELPATEVVVLADERDQATLDDVGVSSTKLVELRNPLPDGTQRRPLLVFIPANLRAAAEDSFGVATFEEVSLGDVYGDLRNQLLADIPSEYRGALHEGLARLDTEERPWPFARPQAQVRFLLTARINGYEPKAIGGALHELALIPDLALLDAPHDAPSRMERNRACVAALTWSPKSERARVLDLGLDELEFCRKLVAFVVDVGLGDPRTWTRQLVLDRANWPLTFDKWPFADEHRAPDAIQITDVESDLPTVAEDEEREPLDQLIGQQVLALGKGGTRKLKLSFRVDPAPKQVRGLAKFVVQVVSKEHGPIGLTRFKTSWKGTRLQASVSFTKLNKVEWDEGWHFFRVLPLTKDGDRLNLADDQGQPISWSNDEDDEDEQARSNESDVFYVLPDGDLELESPQRSRRRAPSLMHARAHLCFAALLDERESADIEVTAVAWTQHKPRSRSSEASLELKFGREGAVIVTLSRPLKELEQRILAAPDGPLHWRLALSRGQDEQATAVATSWPAGDSSERFREARARYFEALRCGDRELVTQGSDLCRLRAEIVEYADSYSELLSELAHRAETTATQVAQQTLRELRALLAIDSLVVTLEDHRGRRREAALVGPTHPLRALWFVTWSELANSWIQAAQESAREVLAATRDGLLGGLVPINFPAVLALPGGRLLTAVDNLGPFWTLYASPHEPDPRGLIGGVCNGLGLPEPELSGAPINGKYLAARMRRYLVQHPYVRTLVVNAFNVGRARAIADMLVILQREDAFAEIRYDVRLFVHDPDTPAVGEALIQLLSPGVGTMGQAADAFSTPTETHLRPKLALAVHHVARFRHDPNDYPAHVSLLFDLFPAEEVGAAQEKNTDARVAVHGLARGFEVEYSEDDAVVAWARSPQLGATTPLTGAEDLSDLLSLLPRTMATLTALTATGGSGASMRPVITLSLGLDERALLHQVHETSDWVFTVDRNMGVEFYDHGGHSERPEYLLDHSPDGASALGHRLVITSRSVAEIEAMVDPVLRTHGFDVGPRQAFVTLNQLRSLSGRLALKLLSASTQRTEALGLALARMYLEHQGVLSNQIVIPLDAHLELYSTRNKSVDELGEEVSFKRTDLALFDLDATTRVITCRLVEVKCYSQVGDLREYERLKDHIIRQIDESQRVLSFHFDPHRNPTDRPDRLLRSRDFVALLEYYLARADRYRTLDEDVSDEARRLLKSLEAGYELRFSRSALIFDLERDGTESAEDDGGVEFHRIGFDLSRDLLAAACERSATVRQDGAHTLEDQRPIATSVPHLERAAFLAPTRDRSESIQTLTGERSLNPHAEEAQVAGQTPAGIANGEQETVAAPNASAPLDAPAPVQLPPATDDTGPNSNTGPEHDVTLGADGTSPQYGVLGEAHGRKVALDLNATHTISLFGVQGGGKSYTLGSIAEMASLQVPGVNLLPQPLATVIFHYSPTMDYAPEFVSMVSPNSDDAQVRALRERYGAAPRALSDVVLLVPPDQLEQRREEFPLVQVEPLEFSASELKASHWRFLMGAVGNQANYIRQINRAIKSLRNDMSIPGLRNAIDATKLSGHLKDLAHMRIDSAEDYVGDGAGLAGLVRPGRLVIVDLRDEFIEKDMALGLFVVLLQLFSEAKPKSGKFNKLIVFDEAHKYISSPDLVAGLVEVVREMRHKGTSVMVASQDPPSVPNQLIELSSQIILHRFDSPAWIKHIQRANAAFGAVTPTKMAGLRAGEAYVWSRTASDPAFVNGAVKVRCRPRVTEHGGGTKTATENG